MHELSSLAPAELTAWLVRAVWLDTLSATAGLHLVHVLLCCLVARLKTFAWNRQELINCTEIQAKPTYISNMNVRCR